MNALYYVSKPDGTEDGPFDVPSIRAAYKAGEYSKKCHVWCEEMEDWQPIAVLVTKCPYSNPLSALGYAFKNMRCSGRAGRKEFWMGMLGIHIILVPCLAVLALLFSLIHEALGGGVVAFDLLAYIPLCFTLSVRRLHDVGQSGFLIMMIPVCIVLNIILFSASGKAPLTGMPNLLEIVLLVLYCKKGQKGKNKYGRPAAVWPKLQQDAGRKKRTRRQAFFKGKMVLAASLVLGAALIVGLIECLPKLFADSLERLQHDAEHGDAIAAYRLGCMYEKGEEVYRDRDEADMWFEIAAADGHPDAQYRMGMKCRDEYVIEHGSSSYYWGTAQKAAMWFRMAAVQGHAAAQFRLGECYEEGIGVPKNQEDARYWYRKAAERGDREARARLKGR